MNRRNFVISVLATPALSSLALPALANGRTLTVGTDIELKPFDFMKNGTSVGFDQDIWAAIANILNVKYVVDPMDFGALIPAIQTHSLDLAISAIFITPARSKVIDFSDPYYVSALGAMIDARNTSIQTAGDLKNTTIAVVTGAAGAAWVAANAPNAHVISFPNASDAFLALQAGRVVAMVHDYPDLAYFVKESGDGTVRMMKDRIGKPIPCGIGFPKGSSLVAPVNAALKEIKTNGTYNTIYAKWFGVPPS